MPSIDVSVGEPKTISRKQVQFRGSWGTFRGLQPFASAYGERLNFKTCPTGCPLRWHSLRTPFSESSGQTPMPGPRDLSACGCSARADTQEGPYIELTLWSPLAATRKCSCKNERQGSAHRPYQSAATGLHICGFGWNYLLKEFWFDRDLASKRSA
jgi:hypothetical protein